MKILEIVKGKWNAMLEDKNRQRKADNKRHKSGAGKFFAAVWRYRGVILAAIVLVLSVAVAVASLAQLPDMVGVDLQSDGSFSFMVPKLIAVLFPFLITLISLFFVLISKRPMYPWLISLFTLSIPLLLYITNVFPA